MSGDSFLVVTLERELLPASCSGGQRCCSASCHPRTAPTTENRPAKMSLVPTLRNPVAKCPHLCSKVLLSRKPSLTSQCPFTSPTELLWGISPPPNVTLSVYSVAPLVPYARGPRALFSAGRAAPGRCGLLRKDMSPCLRKESGLPCSNTRGRTLCYGPSSSRAGHLCVYRFTPHSVQSQPLLAAGCVASGKLLKPPGPQFLHL